MLKVNGKVFGDEYFGNNEAIYKKFQIKTGGQSNIIEMQFEDNRDITNLMMAVNYIRSEHNTAVIEVYLYYLPYSAMDREIDEQVFSLKTFAMFLNRMEARAVYVLDAHNMEVTNGLIKNIFHLSIDCYVGTAMNEFNPDVLYFPDKGAMAKYPNTINTRGLPIIHGNKVRDLKDKGKILTYETITNGVDVKGKRVLIIDDICRKGGTFTWAADELVKLGVGKVGLYVTHCETGIFDGKVLDKDSPISNVYTTNSEPKILEIIREAHNTGNREKIDKLTVYMVG